MKKKWFPEKDKSLNVISAVKNLLYQLNIPVSDTGLMKALINHPHYPSLKSVSEVFSTWKIDNMAVRLDPEDLQEVDFPVLAYIGDPERHLYHFVILTGQKDDQVNYIDTSKGHVVEPVSEFKNKWDGTTLLISKNKDSGENQKSYIENRFKERLEKAKTIGMYALTGILFILIFIEGVTTFHSFLDWLPLMVLKIAGAIVSIFLLKFLLDKQDPTVQKVCKQNNKVSCKDVLDSPAAKLFGWLSMSELSALYFFGGLFLLVLGIFNDALPSVLWILLILNLIALPYTFFSLYYQKKVIGRWCKLCLFVLGIFWLELVTFLPDFSIIGSLPELSTSLISVFVWGFGLPLVIWLAFRSELGLTRRLSEAESELQKLKGNPTIFEEMLKGGRTVEIGEMPNELILGNPESDFVVTVYSDPFCGACSDKHKEVENLLEEAGDLIKLQLRFANNGSYSTPGEFIDEIKSRLEHATSEEAITLKKAAGDTETDWRKKGEELVADGRKKNLVALTVLGLSAAGRTALARKAIRAWYDRPATSRGPDDTGEWALQFPVEEKFIKEAEKSIRVTSRWAQYNQILGAPVSFVNDREFFGAYLQLSDLKYYAKTKLYEKTALKNSAKEEKIEMKTQG